MYHKQCSDSERLNSNPERDGTFHFDPDHEAILHFDPDHDAEVHLN